MQEVEDNLSEENLREEALEGEDSSEEVSTEETLELDAKDEQILSLTKELEEFRDKYLRSVAEFDNFKKRSQKERTDLIKYAGENIARDVLEVVDQLELAIKQEVPEADKEFQKGISLILESFSSTLSQHSIKAEDSLGAVFTPEKHEALATVPTDEHEVGTIIEQFRKAYYFKDKLLRPAQVVVAAKPEESSKESDKKEQEDE